MVPHVEASYTLTLADIEAIEQDHEHLSRCLELLHKTCIHLNDHLGCDSCSFEQLGVCRGRLPSFIHDLVDILTNHFYREEVLMLGMQKHKKFLVDFKAHHDAHVRILNDLNKLFKQVQELDGRQRTDDAYLHFDYIIQGTMLEHRRRFDRSLKHLISQAFQS